MTTIYLMIYGVGFLFTGVIIGYTQGVKVRNLRNPKEPAQQYSKIECMCDHHRGTHVAGKFSCDVSTKPGYVCACKKFVGKPIKAPRAPKNPLDL